MAESDSDMAHLLKQVETNVSSEISDDKSTFLWNRKSTIELIQLYRKYKGLPANAKRSMIWSTISNDMKLKGYILSPKQCENKWKHIAYNYRKFKTGEIDQKACAFFKELHEVLSDSHNPLEFVLTSMETDEPSTSNGTKDLPSPSEQEHNSKKRKHDSTEMPPWFAEFMEEMRVRHEERMAMQREFLQLFRQGTAALNELLMVVKKRKV